MKKPKPKVKLTGGKRKGWIIEISDSMKFHDCIAVTHEEAVELKELLNKKI